MEKVICSNCGTENAGNNKYCLSCGHELPIPVAPVMELPIQEETFTSKLNKSKGLIGALLGIILFTLIVFAIKSLLFNGGFLQKIQSAAMAKAMSNPLEAVVVEMNKQCPVMVDEYTRLDNLESFPPKTLQYNYTLIGVDPSQLDPETLRESLEPQIIENIKTNPQMQIFRLYKAVIVYDYRDESGAPILTISVTPDQYE